MPDDSNSEKKNNDKNKHEPKDQRKPRHSRNQPSKSERKAEKVEETKSEKVHKKPVYEEPGPEFYKNLKRETDEIVKITETENAKYKKKEIQSNWAKYEMPLENYEDLDEHDLGADYEKLIQVPLAAGGHFQFKHEKSWDTSTTPTLYNKYFEINMDNLSTAISTIPFYERNEIDQSEFSETDMLNMNTRASKYKSKYFNDKSFSVEATAQEKVLKSIRENPNVNYLEINDATDTEKTFQEFTEFDDRSDKYEVNLDFNVPKTNNNSSVKSDLLKQDNKSSTSNSVNDFDAFVFKNVADEIISMTEAVDKASLLKDTAPKHTEATQTNVVSKDVPKLQDAVLKGLPVDSKVNSVIQSPEELEKWLDEFLDS